MENVLTIKEVSERLHIGRDKTYKLVNRKDFPKIRIGKTVLIPESKFNEWIEESIYKTIKI